VNIEILIGKLLNYYQIKTLNDLAIKLDTTQSTISGWRARNAIGALTDTVANKAPEALEYIFSSEANINNFQNSNNKVSGSSALIDNSINKSNTNSNNKKENTNIPQSITIELSSLFERLENKDEKFVKNITYKIEDFISDIKKETRD
jgi:lipopolysaccharide biosynthesis protein